MIVFQDELHNTVLFADGMGQPATIIMILHKRTVIAKIRATAGINHRLKPPNEESH